MGRTTSYPSRLAFVADPSQIEHDGGHQIDWANVSAADRLTPGCTVVVGAAGALKDATTVPVDALAVAVPKGTVLNFGGAKFATVDADAAAGATSLTTLAIPTALVHDDAAIFAGSGAKFLPAGTVVGSKLASGPISRRVASTNPAIGILASDAIEGDQSAPSSGYGVIIGGPIYENLLPEATGTPKVLASAVKTELQAAGVGSFRFLQYADNTGT